ncbi:MAG: CoA transferase [Caulobacteraceae bacterium]|nr:CoA transferase [Caulobacteraceae bacterium]
MLEGLRVIEFGSMVAAPAATCLLADWGADVIKIESHQGDPMRGGRSSALGSTNFDLHNRGKRDIALNTAAPDTRDIILRLVKDADIFVTNVLQGQLAKLKLDYETLHPLNPRMVYGVVSSFGQEGPDRNRGATDNLGFWARGGGTALLTIEGEDPLPFRQSVGDRITGISACAAILAALTAARVTGEGRFIDTSLLANGLWAFGTDVCNQLNTGRVVPSRGRHRAAMALANNFKTRDGRWIQYHDNLENLARAFERPDLAADPRFAGPRPPREHQTALIDIVDGIFAQYDLAEARRKLDAVGARHEPVQRVVDVVEDPQAIANGRFVEVMAPQGPIRQVANPWSVFEDGRPVRRPMGPVPKVGEHTVGILQEIGYGEADIARMRVNGTILPDV